MWYVSPLEQTGPPLAWLSTNRPRGALPLAERQAAPRTTVFCALVGSCTHGLEGGSSCSKHLSATLKATGELLSGQQRISWAGAGLPCTHKNEPPPDSPASRMHYVESKMDWSECMQKKNGTKERCAQLAAYCAGANGCLDHHRHLRHH